MGPVKSATSALKRSSELTCVSLSCSSLSSRSSSPQLRRDESLAAGAANRAQPVVYQGYGFDACTAPALSALSAWTVSPYRALGIYVGGVNRACGNGNLSASWVGGATGGGWSLLPLYVGLQAPCVGQAGLNKIAAALATVQGADAASDAVTRAAALGLRPGTPIYFDMEAYKTNDPLCSLVVEDFIAGWVTGLHAGGYVAGVYGSAASTIRDVASLPPGRRRTQSGSRTGTAGNRFSATPTWRTASGPTISGCTSTAAGTWRPTGA